MGFLESFIFGMLGYAVYRKVLQPNIRFRRQCRRRLKEIEIEVETKQPRAGALRLL